MLKDKEREEIEAELKRYAKAIVRYSAEFSVDPWLVAALVYTQSECEPSIDSSYGTGLTLINLGMHARHVKDGVYWFAIRDGNGWVRRSAMRVALTATGT